MNHTFKLLDEYTTRMFDDFSHESISIFAMYSIRIKKEGNTSRKVLYSWSWSPKYLHICSPLFLLFFFCSRLHHYLFLSSLEWLTCVHRIWWQQKQKIHLVTWTIHKSTMQKFNGKMVQIKCLILCDGREGTGTGIPKTLCLCHHPIFMTINIYANVDFYQCKTSFLNA